MKNVEDTTALISNRRRVTAGQTLRQSFVVSLKHGLHARPCAQLVKALRPFRSRVEVQANGQAANGHSIMGLMALAAGPESIVVVSISGVDAPQAMTAVSQLFEAGFNQEEHSDVL